MERADRRMRGLDSGRLSVAWRRQVLPWLILALLAALAPCGGLGWFASGVLAQSSQDDGESSSKKPDEPPPKSDKGVYNPLPAQEDIEVGTFYMHKGDYDAAIPRFQDAITLQPNLAKPRLLLADAYEKKGDKANALKYYKEYLRVFPSAPDAKKVQKKIDKLSREGDD